MARTPIRIEQLRLLPEDDRVEWLRTRVEDQWFDRKSARVMARELADRMVGFANAEGGLIVIGMHRGRIEGVAGAGRRVNEWRQAAVDFTEPPVRHSFELIPCESADGVENELAILEIEASERVHANVKGETYVRIGDENRRLRLLEAQELRYDKGQSVFDGMQAENGEFRDLDPTLVERYGAKIRVSATIEEALDARGLTILKGRTRRPTVAGLLVLGRNPQRVFPQAALRLLRYQGESRETGTRSNVIRDRRLEGPLSEQIDVARRLLRRWLPSAIRLGSQEGRFVRTAILPEYAWLEAIVNGLIHRSYSLGGDQVRVEVFDDRLEVESPGRLPGLVRVENIRSTRFARNPRIARALNDLGYGRELGEGVDRMFEEMERAGLPDPIYRQGPASVKVTLLADPLAKRILEPLPPGSERFVEFLTRRGVVTTTQAVQLFGASRPTALNYLRLLARLGLVEHVGTSLKDPRGFWRLRRGPG